MVFKNPSIWKKLQSLKEAKFSNPCSAPFSPLAGSKICCLNRSKSPTETQLNFVAGRTSEKRVQSTPKISQTVHFFRKSLASLVNGDLQEKTHVPEFISSSFFSRSSLQKIITQKMTEIGLVIFFLPRHLNGLVAFLVSSSPMNSLHFDLVILFYPSSSNLHIKPYIK